MLEVAPPFYLFVALVAAAYILVVMFLGAVREDRPDKFEELRGSNDIFALTVGPLYLAFTCVLPLDYESWGLSRTTVWIGRLLFVTVVMLLLVILWTLVSLIRL